MDNEQIEAYKPNDYYDNIDNEINAKQVIVVYLYSVVSSLLSYLLITDKFVRS